MTERKEYSAGAVKMSFWFMEFRKVVGLLASGKSFDEVRKLNQEENLFAVSTLVRASQIYSTVSGRIRALDEAFNLRVDYLHRMQRIYVSEINHVQDRIENSTNGREIGAATKRKEKL